MAQFTKKAIAETFVALLNEKPFDKITVTDIVNECDINRNTFYYHYQDLFALVDEMFRMEAEQLVDMHTEWHDLKEGFSQMYLRWNELI